MKKQVEIRISVLEMTIEDLKRREQEEVERIRSYAAGANAYSIVEFLPGYIKELAETRRKIAELDEQKRMLVWMLAQAEKDNT